MLEVIRKWEVIPFRYGLDCCQFVRDCVKHETGHDFGAGLEYSTEFGAARILKKHGGMSGLLTHVFGEPVDEPRDGDVAMCIMVDGSEVAAMVFDSRIILRTETGITDWPLSRGEAFWRPACG